MLQKAMPPLCLHMLKRLGAITKDTVFPVRCCSCGRLYHRQHPAGTIDRNRAAAEPGFGHGLTAFLCSSCRCQIEPVGGPLCTQCGRPFDSPNGVDHVCGKCLRDPFEFTMARSAGLYDHALKALIRVYKYQYRAELAEPLARLLWRTLLHHWDLEEIDAVIPVPLHHRRLRQRGFNQSELMVRYWPGLARSEALPFAKGKIGLDVLIRRRNTRSQTGLNSRQRVVNLHHAFQLTDPDVVQGRRILLVDDVMTTGATANACAQVLRHANAASIGVLTLAQAI